MIELGIFFFFLHNPVYLQGTNKILFSWTKWEPNRRQFPWSIFQASFSSQHSTQKTLSAFLSGSHYRCFSGSSCLPHCLFCLLLRGFWLHLPTQLHSCTKSIPNPLHSKIPVKPLCPHHRKFCLPLLTTLFPALSVSLFLCISLPPLPFHPHISPLLPQISLWWKEDPRKIKDIRTIPIIASLLN